MFPPHKNIRLWFQLDHRITELGEEPTLSIFYFRQKILLGVPAGVSPAGVPVEPLHEDFNWGSIHSLFRQTVPLPNAPTHQKFLKFSWNLLSWSLYLFNLVLLRGSWVYICFFMTAFKCLESVVVLALSLSFSRWSIPSSLKFSNFKWKVNISATIIYTLTLISRNIHWAQCMIYKSWILEYCWR